MSSARSRDNKRDSDYQGLLAHYAQRQLKELEIDLKCAHVTATGCLGSSGRRSSTSLVINNRTTTAYPTPASTSVTSGGGPVPVDDEFGDFLSTNVTSSAFPVANNRHQDIVVDRYSVFKHLIDDQTIELDGSLQATTSLLECSENSSDEFGEFKSYSLEANVASSSRNPRFEVFLNVWTKVLRCVRRTLTRCHDLLLGPHVNRQAALQAMDTERGHNFCLGKSSSIIGNVFFWKLFSNQNFSLSCPEQICPKCIDYFCASNKAMNKVREEFSWNSSLPKFSKSGLF